MWLLALTQGFLRMCRTMGWHGRLDQADGGGASGARIRNRKQREENMVHRLYQL